jgi:hypothetical protein
MNVPVLGPIGLGWLIALLVLSSSSSSPSPAPP